MAPTLEGGGSSAIMRFANFRSVGGGEVGGVGGGKVGGAAPLDMPVRFISHVGNSFNKKVLTQNAHLDWYIFSHVGTRLYILAGLTSGLR